ncbi:hypothetical protein JCGZ_22359 [Jatropha curcas]|uniref:HMA domain-containing protein n=1 Tax=Jatropha curcas TaxID=180498 RepID=A0A067L5S2_JATCU|nr:heavy metal-associated isoprenylated plant protein 33 [Jatropha curcas]KDP43732.1 hypothetical protein JCGZ_22359 [Jatropha curcas]
MDSAGHMTCELKVETQSPGWHKTLIKVLKSIEGVSFTIDAEMGIARVSGKIDPDKLLVMLAKAGKHTDLLWLDSGNHLTNASSVHRNVVWPHGYNLHGNFGYGYYNNHMSCPPYGVIDPYMKGPFPPQRSLYYDPPHYQPYYEPPAPSFPQAPPPVEDPRLESFCNMM